jgi:hypothetical protein
MVRILVSYVIPTNFGKSLKGNFRNISLPIVYSVLDKLSMVNDVYENDQFLCLNPVSSWCCGLWSPHSSPYSLQVLGQNCYFPSVGRISRRIYTFRCKSASSAQGSVLRSIRYVILLLDVVYVLLVITLHSIIIIELRYESSCEYAASVN